MRFREAQFSRDGVSRRVMTEPRGISYRESFRVNTNIAVCICAHTKTFKYTIWLLIHFLTGNFLIVLKYFQDVIYDLALATAHLLRHWPITSCWWHEYFCTWPNWRSQPIVSRVFTWTIMGYMVNYGLTSFLVARITFLKQLCWLVENILMWLP